MRSFAVGILPWSIWSDPSHVLKELPEDSAGTGSGRGRKSKDPASPLKNEQTCGSQDESKHISDMLIRYFSFCISSTNQNTAFVSDSYSPRLLVFVRPLAASILLKLQPQTCHSLLANCFGTYGSRSA